VELLHRHVLLCARERAGDVAVDAVAEDAIADLRAGCVLRDQCVEGALGVEHHRVELTARRQPMTLEELGRHALLVHRHLVEPEAVREPTRGVDRQAQHLAALRRRMQRERGRGGRLADTAAADGHHHPMLRQNFREPHGRAA